MVARSVRDAEVPGSSPGTPTVADWTIEVALAPAAAIDRIASSINLPRKRLFGVVKTRAEYVGVIDGESFEVWVRRDRAVHAFGEARAARGGTRVDATFRLSPVSRGALVVFFPLYLLGAAGLATLDGPVSTIDVLVAAGGLATMIVFFVDADRRQRRALRQFLDDVLTNAG